MAQHGEIILRTFKDFDDLFDNVENEQILTWINEWAAAKPRFEKLSQAEEKRNGYHKVYQEKKKISMKLLTERLDPDELKRIKELAEQAVAAREDAS